MSYQATLKRMESMLESFLDRVVELKEDRLRVIGGINRLDDIARDMQQGNDLTDQVGQWFAQNNRFLEQRALRPAEHRRIGRILSEIRKDLPAPEHASPAVNKISAEIDRWLTASVDMKAAPAAQTPSGPPIPRLVLRRGPEGAPAKAPEPKTQDSIERFDNTLDRVMNLFKDCAGNKQHLMSALDDSLKSAMISGSRDALVLSATIIYYLKQQGYKVEPFVKRLKEAEHALNMKSKGEHHA